MILVKTTKIIGLTGQSGAGKSTVSDMFRTLGAFCVDADKVARKVVEPGEPALSEILSHFGEKVLNPDGSLNRSALAAIVFSDKEELHILNRITHKYIKEDIDSRIASCEETVAVIYAPTLFESGIDKECDVIVSVLADKETRIRRIMARDALTREKAEARINAQKDDAFFRKRSDYVLENNRNPEELKPKVSEILKGVCL